MAEETLPWSFTLDVPRFDPREDLLPDTRVSSLALALTGKGTLERGTVSGEISVDDGVMHVDPLSFVRHEEDVEIEGVLRPGEKGRGDSSGRQRCVLPESPWQRKPM